MDSVRLFPLDGARRRHPEVQEWFDRGEQSDLRTLARRWFEVWRSCGPDVVELLHDGQPTACVKGIALGYVAVYRAHMNIGFYLGAALPDPAGLLQGTGRYMRHVRIQPEEQRDEAALEQLISSAYMDLKARLCIR